MFMSHWNENIDFSLRLYNQSCSSQYLYTVQHKKNAHYRKHFKFLNMYIISTGTYDIKSKSLKMKVFSISNPQAMMSLAFSNAMWLACSRVRSFHRYFSSSVSCMTSGTSKVSCNHLWTSIKFTVSLRYHSLYTSSYTMVLSKQHVPDF